MQNAEDGDYKGISVEEAFVINNDVQFSLIKLIWFIGLQSIRV